MNGKWDHQPIVIAGLRAGFVEGHRRQILSAPTGSGKSVIMLEMIKAAIEKGTRTIFICERRNLVFQFSDHLQKSNIDHGVIMSGHWRHRPDALIQVASAQSLEKMETWPDFKLAFIDEVHANMRKSIMNMMDVRKGLRVVGATATPFHPMLSKYFTNVVSAPPMAELVNLETLVPYRTFVAHEINTKGVKLNNKGEWAEKELEERGQAVVGDIVADYIRLSSEVFGRKSKAICFSCGIAHGASLVQQFAAAGVNAIQLASGVDDEFKADVLRDFARPDTTIDMLISVDMLSRGFDQTDIEHVILARPLKKSFSQHVQMIGRGARSHPEKTLCVIQDHCSNSLRFMDQWNEFYHNGVTTLDSDADAVKKKEPTEKEKTASKCPKCGVMWPARSDTCLHCGHTRQRASEISPLPGEMLELTGQKIPSYTSEFKEHFYQGMIGYLRAIGKNENGAYYAYISKFKVAPAWKKVAGAYNTEIADYVNSSRQNFARKQSYGRKSG